MKKFIYIIFGLSLAFLYACDSCETLYYDFVGSPTIVAQGEDPSSFAIDTTDIIQGIFMLDLNFVLDVVVMEEGTIDCDEIFNQTLDPNSVTVRVDQVFKQGNDQVSAGTNLANMEGVSIKVSTDQLRIEFNQSFVDNNEFLPELHTWTISVNTDTGNSYTASIPLKMEI